MKIKKLKNKNIIGVDEGIIVNSIKNYIENTSFPKKLLLENIKTKNIDLSQKRDKMIEINKKMNLTLNTMYSEMDKLDIDNKKRIQSLKNELF
jgi:autotransporter adhesin